MYRDRPLTAAIFFPAAHQILALTTRTFLVFAAAPTTAS